MSNYYLIVDQGGHNTRALVFNAAGEAVADARCDVATQCPADGFVEQDPAEMVTSLRTVCDGIARQLGNDVSKIVSAALVTQRSSLVCWDKTSGEALTPVLSWQDVRAEDSQELAALEAEELTITTGLRPSPHYGASKIRWCLDNVPEVQQALLEEIGVWANGLFSALSSQWWPAACGRSGQRFSHVVVEYSPWRLGQ